MTYQGERARDSVADKGLFFEVSKIRLGADGHVSEVLWGQVNSGSDQDVGPHVVALAAEVVDAIHEGASVVAVFPPTNPPLLRRSFVVVEHPNGMECITFGDSSSPGGHLADMDILHPPEGASAHPRDLQSPARTKGRMPTFAVSKVKLDEDGRVTAVLWGKVDTRKNEWATPEVVVPVAEVVAAIDGGIAVFALFASAQGHLPERRFMNVDYDDGWRTIVLDGPATHEREIHDMDRLV